jgi:hypothetical protein
LDRCFDERPELVDTDDTKVSCWHYDKELADA